MKKIITSCLLFSYLFCFFSIIPTSFAQKIVDKELTADQKLLLLFPEGDDPLLKEVYKKYEVAMDKMNIASSNLQATIAKKSSASTPEEKNKYDQEASKYSAEVEKYYQEAMGYTKEMERVLQKGKEVRMLPKGTPQQLIAGIIRVMLAIGGTLAGIGVLTAGVLYVTAQGNEEMSKKAKDILIYSIIGLILIAVSYALFTGLATIISTQ